MTSKRRLRRRGCQGKHIHPTEAAAWAATIHAQRDGITGIRPYKCRFRDHWHVGHPPARVRQALAAKQRRAA